MNNEHNAMSIDIDVTNDIHSIGGHQWKLQFQQNQSIQQWCNHKFICHPVKLDYTVDYNTNSTNNNDNGSITPTRRSPKLTYNNNTNLPATATATRSPSLGSIPNHAYCTVDQPIIFKGHRGPVSCIQFDSSKLVYSSGSMVRIHSLISSLIRPLGTLQQKEIITTVDYNTRVLVTGSIDKTLRLYSFDTFDCMSISSKKHAHQDSVTQCKFTSDNQHVISVSLDSTLKLWNVSNNTCIETYNRHDEHNIDLLLQFCSVDDNQLYAISTRPNDDNTDAIGKLALFDLRYDTGVVDTVEAEQSVLSSIDVYGNTIACGDVHGNVLLYDRRKLTDSYQQINAVPQPIITSDTNNNNNAQPIRYKPYVQSLHIDDTKLIVCQRGAISVHSLRSDTNIFDCYGLPYNTLISQFTVDQLNLLTPANNNTTQNHFTNMSYDNQHDVLAISTTDSVLIYNVDRPIYAVSTPPLSATRSPTQLKRSPVSVHNRPTYGADTLDLLDIGSTSLYDTDDIDINQSTNRRTPSKQMHVRQKRLSNYKSRNHR